MLDADFEYEGSKMNDREIYCAVASDLAPVGFDTYIALTAGGKQKKILSAEMRSVLGVCYKSGTVDELTTRAIRQLGLEDRQKGWVEATLQYLRQEGMLAPVRQLVAGSGQSTTPPITSVSFPMAGRPRHIMRALASFESHFRIRGRHCDFLIMDDSKSPSSRSEHILALRTCDTGNRPLRYAGALEKEAYIAELMRAGIAPELARFAILGTGFGEIRTTGANRNSILLDTVGEHVLSVDDDVVCKIARHPQAGAGLRLQGHSHPRDYWFFENRAETWKEAVWDEESDFVAEHERLLGKSIRQAAAKEPAGNLDVEDGCSHLMHALGTHVQAKIATTISGVIGDPGSYAASPWLTIRGPSFARLVQSQASFSNAIHTREVLSVAPAFVVSHNPFCQSMALGLANDGLLPPFFPVGRNQDGVFGTLLHLMAPSAFLAHIPVAVLHDPDSQRTYAPLVQFRIAEFIMSLALNFVPAYRRGSGDFLRHLGAELNYLAGLSKNDFWDCINRTGTNYVRQQLFTMDLVARQSPGAPEFWHEKLRAVHDELVRSSAQPDSFVPLELRSCADREEAERRTQELVRLAGSLFYHWLDLVEAARTLRQKGIRISAELDSIRPDMKSEVEAIAAT